MIKKICLLILIANISGIAPLIAQNSGAAANIIILDLGLASDEEFSQALEKAKDLEFINKADNLDAPVSAGQTASVDQAEPDDQTAYVEQAEPDDQTAYAEQVEPDEQTAYAEQAEPTEQTASTEQTEPTEQTASAESDETYENEYLAESRRLAALADEAFAEGDYDTSAKYADEAALLAKQSDVFVAIAKAKRYIDQAVSSGVSVQYSPEYREAESWYDQSLSARDDGEWDIAFASANMVVELLEGLDASAGAAPSRVSSPNALPATYTVRPWSVSKDCFWNIAGFPWVYGNPRQWRVLYNANKSKLENPNNPNVLEPGTVLDIPSIKGELREGAWESGRSYEPLR
jgi:nucleoid-associated protein YgaU